MPASVMNMNHFAPALCALLIALSGQTTASVYAKPKAASGLCSAPIPPNTPTVLYDSAVGNLPNAQQWQFVSSPGAQASQTYAAGVTTLNTYTQTNDSAGYFVAPTQPITLERSLGFALNFSVVVLAEAHNNAQRAGFSVIVIADDGKGIELGFWQNSVWAQGDGIHPSTIPLFNRAEAATLDTGTPMTYQLGIVSDTYTLLANGVPILTGPVRDYSAFNGFPDPYEQPNLIFMGDDSTSARATVTLGNISIQTCPATLPPPPAGTTRFAVIGDFGKLNSQENIDVAAAIHSWNVDFVTTVGDNSYCYNNGVADPYDDCVARYYHEWISPYTGQYGAGASENRFWPVMGNHDWDTGVIAYTSAFSLPNNERYYDVVRGPVQFLMLSSDPREPDGNTFDSTQGTWLQNKLGQSTAPWKLVYMHHPPYSSSSVHGSSAWMQWPFKDWGATAVLAGHDHTYERIDQDGLPYFVSGLGGQSVYAFGTPIASSVVRYNSDYGAMLVEASDCAIWFRFITRAGAVIDSFSQRRTCVAATPTPTPTSIPNTTIWFYLPLAIR